MIDLEVLSEAYLTLKQYIPSKDRQEAADNLMSVLVDMLDDEQLKVVGGVDSYLTKAVKEFVEEEDYDDDGVANYDDE
jgi:hypothetical protein